MNVERTDLETRAAKHAALSDPSRLRIVDLLTLGDLSPTEITVALRMPSNLVAHHLNVLEAAHLIVRTRSEADRRRSYVRLGDDAAAGLLPGRTARAHRVVFVCTANSARSQLAAALWAHHSGIPATSAGTHPAQAVSPGAAEAARRHALDLDSARPHPLDAVVTETDFIVTVCDTAHEELAAPSDLHWSIPDPVRLGTDEAFDAAYAELERRIVDLAPRLTPA